MAGRANRAGVMDEFATLKLDAATGDFLWKSFDGGPDLRDDVAWDVVVDPDGHPVVTGVSVNADETASFLTIKYDTTDGQEIWRRRIDGALNDPASRAGWLACDASGDLYMANRTWVSGSSFDVVLHRYASSDGQLMWSSGYDGPAHGSDNLRDMILDPTGHPVVVGVSSSNFLALRFDPIDGSLDWDAVWNGPAGGYDLANCAAIGPGGEILVGGFCTGDGTSWDVAVVALAPGDGSAEWQLIYDGDDSLTDEGKVLAVSPLGDIYVGGYSYDAVTGMDLLALRYRQAAIGIGPQTAAPTPLATIAPNPFRTGVRWSVPDSRGLVRLDILDVSGRRIASYPIAGGVTGAASVVWDGRDGAGRPVAAGAYILRAVSTGGGTTTVRATRVR